MYWLNIEWADGTESTFEDSKHFRSKATAISQAHLKHNECGCPVYVIRDGKVIAAFVGGKRTNPRPNSSPLLPAKVRINPRTGKVQVFVTPKVAAQVRGRNPNGSSSRIPVGLKYLIVGSNGKTFKATNLSEVARMKKILKNQGVTVKVVKLPKGSTTWNT